MELVSHPDVLTQKEMKLLLQATDKGRSLNKQRDKMLIYLLYASGMRISEALKLQVKDLHLDQNRIRVFGKRRKERIIPLPTSCITLLEIYITTCDRYLFTSQYNNKTAPLSRQSALKAIKKIWQRTGINKNIYPHLIRHSYATHMLQNGMSLRQIQMLLGHDTMQSTQEYVSPSIDEIKRIYDGAHIRS